MPITESQMQTRFPETFPVTFPVAILTAAIAEAELRIDRDSFGDLADAAAIYLAAHIATRDRRASADGVQSATAGPVSVTFRSEDLTNQSSSFFMEYQRIIRATNIPVGLGCW